MIFLARIQQLTQWAKAQFAAIALKFKKKPPPAVTRKLTAEEADLIHQALRASTSPAPPPPPPPPPPKPPDPESSWPPGGQPINRAERRRLERLRRRHDKFVTPKGPKPAKNKHEPTPPQPTPQPKPPDVESAAPTYASGNMLMYDKHHEDREGEDVLYEETELYGQFNFRDTILQQLERYFVYIERLKRDIDSYEFYRQVGATVVPYLANNAHNRWNEKEDDTLEPQKELPAWFRQVRPAFGCFVYGADPESEKYEMEKKLDPDGHKTTWWIPKFMYFTKYSKPPPTLQSMSGGDIYKMTIWWDRPFDPKYNKRRKYGVPNDFGIFVSADGKEVVALRMIDTKYTRVYSKKKHEEFWVPQRLWHIPNDYEEWAKQHGKDAQRMLTDIFIESVERLYLAQGSMVRVAATKNGCTATFGVNIDRMSYFFQDRDINLTEDGHRKHVFHMVRPHTRKDGTHIKFHFRGERQFTWAGYDILITVPGRDHYILDEMNVGAIDEYWIDSKKGNIDMKEFGKRLDKDIRKGFGGYRPH